MIFSITASSAKDPCSARLIKALLLRCRDDLLHNSIICKRSMFDSANKSAPPLQARSTSPLSKTCLRTMQCPRALFQKMLVQRSGVLLGDPERLSIARKTGCLAMTVMRKREDKWASGFACCTQRQMLVCAIVIQDLCGCEQSHSTTRGSNQHRSSKTLLAPLCRAPCHGNNCGNALGSCESPAVDGPKRKV